MTNAPATLPSFGAPAPRADIQAIKPPIVLPDYIIWIWIALGIILLAAVIFFWWKFYRKVPQVAPQPVTPPHDKARQRLQEAFALIDQPKVFCVAVSDTIRTYLEERFNFHAPDRTTEEFLYELKNTNLLLPDQKQSLGDFLSVCDMVKFARYEPGREELKALFDSANRLVDETEPLPEPVPDGAAKPA